MDSKRHECEPIHTEVESARGVYEWVCVTCGWRRRFEGNKMIIKNRGDLSARHFGSVGPIMIGRIEASQDES